MIEKLIVMHGNPVGGFSFVGPFDSSSDATEYADTELSDEWWIVPLHAPQGEGEQLPPPPAEIIVPEGDGPTDLEQRIQRMVALAAVTARYVREENLSLAVEIEQSITHVNAALPNEGQLKGNFDM